MITDLVPHSSSCKPCVKELYREQLRVWRECHPDGAESDEEQDEEAAKEEKAELSLEKERRKLEKMQRESPKVEIGVEDQLAALSVKEAQREQKRALAKGDAW